MTNQQSQLIYWKKNIQYVVVLLAIWFIVSFGFGILFADSLNQVRLGGFKLGFWFAQQGSILVFVILIFVYIWLMNNLDAQFKSNQSSENLVKGKKE